MRCTEAGAYARDFVTGVVGVLQATLVGGSVFPTTAEEQAELERLPCTRGPDGGDCGCCQACCQGIQKRGRCTKCWARGVGCRLKYVKEEEAARLSGNTRAAGKRGRTRSEDAGRRTEAESTEDAEERTEAEITEGEGRSHAGLECDGEHGGAPSDGAGVAVETEDAESCCLGERTDEEVTAATLRSGSGAEGEESEEEGDDDSFEPQDYWERTGDQLIRHHVTRRTGFGCW